MHTTLFYTVFASFGLSLRYDKSDPTRSEGEVSATVCWFCLVSIILGIGGTFGWDKWQAMEQQRVHSASYIPREAVTTSEDNVFPPRVRGMNEAIASEFTPEIKDGIHTLHSTAVSL